MTDKPNTKRKAPERRPAGIKAMSAPATRELPDDHPARRLFKEAAASEGTSPTPRTPPTPPTDATHPIAPERDFVRVPNSVARDVVPAGHFVGKSKQLYDCLFQRTRGAIVPTRRLAISKPELMRVSGIGSERTLLKNLGHLRDLGLVRVTYTDGKHEGNTYEVFTPEEAGLRTPPTPPTPRHARAEVPSVPPVESGVRDVGSEPLESITSDTSKTSFKTNTEKLDDEASRLAVALSQAERELTGKNAAKGEQWDELASVLITELRIAAGRTTVSSVPAFLAEHLRRRLFKKDKRQLEAESLVEADSAQKKGITGDISKCPDCFGTSMYYPEGFDKGVARCEHPSLRDS